MSALEAGPSLDGISEAQAAPSIPMPLEPEAGVESGVEAEVIDFARAQSIVEFAGRLTRENFYQELMPGEDVTGFVGPDPKNGCYAEPLVWDFGLRARVTPRSRR
jgi:hypothetical protein